MRQAMVLLAGIFCCTAAYSVQNQDGEDAIGIFAGTWSLASWKATTDGGETRHPFGADAVGRITYDQAGRMSVQLMNPQRSRLSSDDPEKWTTEELEPAFRGYFAYFGSFTVQAAEKTVTHHLEAASVPNWVGTKQIRGFRFSDDGKTLVLTARIVEGGVTVVHELEWKRLNAD